MAYIFRFVHDNKKKRQQWTKFSRCCWTFDWNFCFHCMNYLRQLNKDAVMAEAKRVEWFLFFSEYCISDICLCQLFLCPYKDFCMGIVKSVWSCFYIRIHYGLKSKSCQKCLVNKSTLMIFTKQKFLVSKTVHIKHFDIKLFSLLYIIYSYDLGINDFIGC